MFRFLISATLAVGLLWGGPLFGQAVTGKITAAESGEALPFATVQLPGTGKSTVANVDGNYRILASPGPVVIKFSHIGYFSFVDTIDVTSAGAVLDVSLRSSTVIVPGSTVYTRQYDPAQLIILEAIKRKQEILNRLGAYDYRAYTKMVVRDLSRPDSVEIMAITESQSQSFWERPHQYKEIIIARRQSANLDAVDNLVAIGEFLNFNKNRLEIGQYSVVSPVAEDALKYYNYYLLDSTWVDGNKVFKLEAEPKNQADALVAGYIFIADSTYDVVDVEVGFNEGVRLPFVTGLKYSQRVAPFADHYWMPVEIKFGATIEIDFPGIPDEIGIDLAASIYDYSFEIDHPDHTFDEFVFEVADSADRIDSLAWSAGQSIPLSLEELRGYARIDSVERAPKPLGKRLAMLGLGAAAIVTFGAEDLFRFNRVEGAYVGLATDLTPHRNLEVKVGSGFASAAEISQYQASARYRVPGRPKFTISGEYHRRVEQAPIVNADRCNPTFSSLFFKIDPANYHYERGGSLSLTLNPTWFATLKTSVHDLKYRSLSQNTDYSLFGGEDPFRENPPVVAGNLRLLSAGLELDSRKLWRNKGRERKLETVQYSLLKVGAELSDPDLLSSDFEYRRYWASFSRRQRTAGLGMTQIDLFAGAATRSLPTQRYYYLSDYSEVLAPEESKFLTIGENFFAGNRAAFVYVRHDFGQYLFRKSGLPLIKRLPFTLGVHGGVFWSEFKNHSANSGDNIYLTAARPYQEIGFSLGNLTPFLSVFNFAAFFTWQLSDYDTHKFTTRLGIRF